MKMTFSLLCWVVAVTSGWADLPVPAGNASTTEAAAPQGVIILQGIAGYPPAAVSFVSIQWTDNTGGYVVDAAGAKTPFLNDAIGRIFYFDQNVYEEVDHDQYWVDWRAGLQRREAVVPPANAIRLTLDDVPQLKGNQAVLQDAVQRFSISGPVLQPMIATYQDDISKLGSGLILQNGQWISANSPAAASQTTPVIGEGDKLVTFTTKSGKTYSNARVAMTPGGISAITSDGGGSIPFEQIPDDISAFPKALQNQIKAGQAKVKAQQASVESVASPSSAAASGSAAPKTFWDTVQLYWQMAVNEAISLYNTAAPYVGLSSPTTTTSPSSSTTNSGKPVAPHSASGATPASSNPAAALSANAVVIIKGDYAEGTGFLAKTNFGVVVFTNLHVIAANPNLRILTSRGEQIQTTDLKGASDRDLAMFTIIDNHYPYLDLAPNVEQAVTTGDPTVIPGNSEGGEVTLKTDGKVVGIGPQLVEFDNPIYHGNSGGPVYDTKTGNVVAVVVAASRMAPTNEVDKSSFANANSAIKGPMRYFGFRIDTVPEWQEYDQSLFVSETMFLKNFHTESRALDSFLNGAGYGNASSSEEGPPTATEYLGNDEVRKISDQFHRTLQDHDRITALQEVVFSLGNAVDENLPYVENFHQFYPYDRERAKFEVTYRKALKAEIDRIRAITNNPNNTSQGGNYKL